MHDMRTLCARIIAIQLTLIQIMERQIVGIVHRIMILRELLNS